MKLAKPFLMFSALALAFGAYAAGDKPAKQAKADQEPGFNNLDSNHDGKLTRTEAAKDKGLMAQWKEADRNNDGTLSRAEYLMVKGKKDMDSLTGKVKSAVSSDDKSASTGSTTSKSK